MTEDRTVSQDSPARPPGQARRTQRLGAYAVVLREDRHGVEHLLLTRVSPTGYPAGWWALPGGGVDHGESPNLAVLRELHEETGLRARSARLVDVHDLHVVEEGRDDRWEDYHGVHLLYATQVEIDGAGSDGAGSDGAGLPEPHVVEVGGTTDRAAWIPVSDLPPTGSGPGRLLAAVEHVLAHLDDYR